MLDPLTALGVAGNCLQLIDFGCKLVSEGNEIYHATGGAIEDNVVAEALSNDLSSLTKSLSGSLTKWVENHGNTQLDADETRLRNICDRCTEIAVELNVHLQKLRVDKGQKFQRLRSYKQALISVWQKDKINAIEQRLDKYHREIDTHILIGLRKSAEEAQVTTSAQFAALDQRTQELTISVLDHDQKLTSRFDDQSELLARIHDHTTQLLQRERTPSPLPEYEIVEKPQDGLKTSLHEAAEAGNDLKLRQILRFNPLVDIKARDEYGCTPLHLASSGKAASVILKHDPAVKNVEDYGGRSALHCAVLKRRLDVIKTLLEAGIDQTLEDDDGRTALYYATPCPAAEWMLIYGHETEARAANHLNNTGLFQMAWIGDLEGVEFFLRHKANVNSINDWHETALTETARHGNPRIVELLIQNGANLEIGSREPTGANENWTPLLQTVRDSGYKTGREEVVRLLLKHGANKDAKLKKGGCNALAEACLKPHFDIAKILIEAGSNIDSLDWAGKTPLMQASERGDASFVRWLLQQGPDKEIFDPRHRTAAYFATNDGHAETLKALLESGANANVIAEDGFTVLSRAAARGHLECVRLLLKHGANPNVSGTHASAYTALAEACHHNRLDIAILLLVSGAKWEVCSRSGYSALSIAAYRGNHGIVRMLAERGADIEQTGFRSKGAMLSDTPLMRAAAEGRIECVKVLIEFKANLDAHDARGYTALHFAVEKKHTECAALLIRSGANVDITDDKKETALMKAAFYGNAQIIKLLVEANANVRLKDWRGCSAWVFAVHQGHEAKIEHLLKPGDDQDQDLQQMQATCHPSEIAAYMNKGR